MAARNTNTRSIPDLAKSLVSSWKKDGDGNYVFLPRIADIPLQKQRAPDKRQRARTRTLVRDNFKCRICGRHGIAAHLNVHYIDGNALNDVEGNLIILCTRCHRIVHLKGIDLAFMTSPNCSLQEP